MISKKALQQQIKELSEKLENGTEKEQGLTEKLFNLNQQMKAYEAQADLMNPANGGVNTPTIEKAGNSIIEADDSFMMEGYIEVENFGMKGGSMINIKHNTTEKNKVLKNIFRIAFLYERCGLTIDNYDGKIIIPVKKLENGDLEAYEIENDYSYDSLKANDFKIKKDKKIIVKNKRYAIMDLGNDNLGFIARGGLQGIVKLIYFRRLRDKNASFLSIIADTSNSGRSNTNFITKFNCFTAQDKTHDNADFYAERNKQPVLGDKIKGLSAGSEVRTTFDLNIEQVKIIEEELNTRFGFPIQSADGKQTLSKESSQFQSTYLNIQKFILEEVNNFIKDSNIYLDTKILFRKNEEFEELNQIPVEEEDSHNGNSNATKKDTQAEIDKKTNKPLAETGGDK